MSEGGLAVTKNEKVKKNAGVLLCMQQYILNDGYSVLTAYLKHGT